MRRERSKLQPPSQLYHQWRNGNCRQVSISHQFLTITFVLGLFATCRQQMVHLSPISRTKSQMVLILPRLLAPWRRWLPVISKELATLASLKATSLVSLRLEALATDLNHHFALSWSKELQTNQSRGTFPSHLLAKLAITRSLSSCNASWWKPRRIMSVCSTNATQIVSAMVTLTSYVWTLWSIWTL